jgi:hypothetical protein
MYSQPNCNLPTPNDRSIQLITRQQIRIQGGETERRHTEERRRTRKRRRRRRRREGRNQQRNGSLESRAGGGRGQQVESHEEESE